MSQFPWITEGADRIIGLEQLESRIAKGKKLRVKLGVDPTRPDLTFGHCVVLRKLRQFQDHGHTAVLIIGDYTASIGDPSGRSETRPVLTKEEIAYNAKTYLDQAYKVLDPAKTEVRHNSEWFSKMSFDECLALARRMTVARMLERDDFSKRYKAQTPISIVEFLYPLVQGYDSIMVESDIELGGSDQLFNCLVGRALQQDEEGMDAQAVLCMPLLVGLDGQRKMSKSYDNYIALTDTPKDMFGKLMSISDETMWTYYQLLCGRSDAQVKDMQSKHPMACKKALAVELVSMFYDEATAKAELEAFENVFSKGELPEDMASFHWASLTNDADETTLLNLVFETGLFGSKKELKRLIEQGGLKMDDQKYDNPFAKLTAPSASLIFKVGKRTYFSIGPSQG